MLRLPLQANQSSVILFLLSRSAGAITCSKFKNAPDPKRLESYWEPEKFQHDFLAPDLDSLYESLELPKTLDFEKDQKYPVGATSLCLDY
jgi:hypothetical protein